MVYHRVCKFTLVFTTRAVAAAARRARDLGPSTEGSAKRRTRQRAPRSAE